MDSERYEPRPIPVDGVSIPIQLAALLERLAENAHDVWARQRLAENWRWGQSRSDELKEHPGLVAYCHLSDGEKEYDRLLVGNTIRAILALGYQISLPQDVESVASRPLNLPR
jgi:hypothetical protein